MQKYALISVSEKRGIIPFARAIEREGFRIIATSKTAQNLRQAHIQTILIEEITGYPAILSGRVKTLHPKIFGGILFDRSNNAHRKTAGELDLPPIDLIVVNLYRFPSKRSTNHPPIDSIDIGGASLLRAAAKNYHAVTAVCDPEDYPHVASMIRKKGETTLEYRRALAAKAFLCTAMYDATIASCLSLDQYGGVFFVEKFPLRYGENPHQKGAYASLTPKFPLREKIWSFHQGKPLSYCNILDADAAYNIVSEFRKPTVALLKHTNPCGVASHHNVQKALQHAHTCDPTSSFGVIIGINRTCPASVIQYILTQQMFVEVIVAPSFSPQSLILLKKKPNIRLISTHKKHPAVTSTLYRSAIDGLLIQERDTTSLQHSYLRSVTKRKPTSQEARDLLFAWHVVKHTDSNAIVFAKNQRTVGIGCGQTSRIDAVALAVKHAGDRSKGAVMASDAFFPFPDSIYEAAKVGISAIIQPGGSVRDHEAIAAANTCGIAMVLTGIRSFRH